MKIFTLQSQEVFNTLQSTGVFRATKSRAENLQSPDDFETFGKAYEYMTDIMLLKGIEKPLRYDFKINTPIWGYYLHNGKHFVDLRKETRVFPKGTCCIELEIPDKDVLLSGYETWHFALNRWYLPENYWYTDDFKDVEHTTAEIENSWARCFSKEFLQHEKYIQGTFFEMRLNQVKNVRVFGSK